MINDNRFSVLAIPDSLNFYLNSEDGCKQEFKIYNVHDFAINFKVLCTSVDDYHVEPPFGIIRPGRCIKIQIQLKNHAFDHKKDVFRIEACSKENNKIVGDKDLTAHIHLEKLIDNDDEIKTDRERLKETKSDDKLSNQQPKSKTIQIDNLQNMVIITTTRFCLSIVLVFLVGMITGMILNAPADLNQMGLD